MFYLLHLLFLGLLYAALGMSLNLVAGYTGMMSLCHGGFLGLGAYSVAVVTLRYGYSWPPAVAVAALLSLAVAWGLGSFSLRFRGDDFVIVTFSFQVILYRIAQNWSSLTGGPPGLAGVPPPKILGLSFDSPQRFALLAALLALLVMAVLGRLVDSPYGRVLRAIRGDEVLALSLGKAVHSYKRSVFVIGAVIAALAGCLYAPYFTYVNPDSFTTQESIFIIAIVVVGGAGRLWGSVVGAFLLLLLPELLRFLGLPSGTAAILRQMLYGALLLGCVLWRPDGLLGEGASLAEERG